MKKLINMVWYMLFDVIKYLASTFAAMLILFWLVSWLYIPPVTIWFTDIHWSLKSLVTVLYIGPAILLNWEYFAKRWSQA